MASRLPSDHMRILAEDVVWLTDNGESPEMVARQLHYKSADNLAATLERFPAFESVARRLRYRSEVAA